MHDGARLARRPSVPRQQAAPARPEARIVRARKGKQGARRAPLVPTPERFSCSPSALGRCVRSVIRVETDACCSRDPEAKRLQGLDPATLPQGRRRRALCFESTAVVALRESCCTRL